MDVLRSCGQVSIVETIVADAESMACFSLMTSGKHVFRFFRSSLTRPPVGSLPNASRNKTASPAGGKAPWKKTEDLVVGCSERVRGEGACGGGQALCQVTGRVCPAGREREMEWNAGLGRLEQTTLGPEPSQDGSGQGVCEWQWCSWSGEAEVLRKVPMTCPCRWPGIPDPPPSQIYR